MGTLTRCGGAADRVSKGDTDPEIGRWGEEGGRGAGLRGEGSVDERQK